MSARDRVATLLPQTRSANYIAQRFRAEQLFRIDVSAPAVQQLP